MQHEGRRGTDFPQNRYIFPMVRKLAEKGKARRCQLHQEEEETLFCHEAKCQKTICIICLSERHLGHKVVALKIETKDILDAIFKNIEATEKELKC